MRKQFNQLKDFVHNKTISRNERQDVLSRDILESEKHMENIKQSLANAEKKISNSLLSGTSDSSSVTPEKKIKKLASSSLSTFFNDASECLAQTKKDSILCKTFHLCAQLQKEMASNLSSHETDIENQCISRIHSYVNEDLPKISSTRKQLNRTHSELNALKLKYESTQKAMQNSSQLSQSQTESKLELLRNDLDDNNQKLCQFRDVYETELLDFLSKEISIASVFYDYVKLQADYHEKMLAQINHYIPVLEGVIANTTQKPVFEVSLEEHLRTSGRQISVVIETCIKLLLPFMEEEGIFRISGSVSKVKLIRSAFNAGHLDTLDLTRDVHSIASTLKSYLRELPEPLLTFDLHQDWIKAASERDPQEKLKAIWTVCNSLPEANKNNLRYLIKFLYELTKHSDVNKMSSHNLAIAIGPSLFWSSGESMELSMSNFSFILVEALITHCDDYFFPEEVVFVSKTPKTVDSISDSSDPEISNSNTKSRLKKPAPKPPGTNTNEPSANQVSYNSELNLTKIGPKTSSLRLKTNNRNPSNEHVKNHFETVQRVDSPPAMVATIRPHNLSPRVDNARSRRPVSVYERPMVPPPEVPPRPSVNKSQFALDKSDKQRNSMLDLTENSDSNESLSQSEENLLEINLESTKSTASLYPSLNEFQTAESDNAPFTYPCNEFIDENQSSLCSSSENIMEYSNSNGTLPPQKPPRSSLANQGNQNGQDMVRRSDLTPPQLPSRPSKSPSPLPSTLIADKSSLPTANNNNVNSLQIERTYL
ncbi:hypothetical protein RDWZM_007581 [Blomia tropicalis]|uniref:Rho-GAP domain-containing protein n=1 Tax=Blomia tropicalis TaxID=40697 RepID=A0A9Q0M016_BLOTA|nr:Rho GTPase-activating protein 17 [Blomia tropicalis]KAJ6216424.1 hypothetical protein RDWZM_007581 [Blomia tropicalis]